MKSAATTVSRNGKAVMMEGHAFDADQGESVVITTSPSPVPEIEAAEHPPGYLVERAICEDIILPLLRWIIDADGRGAMNKDAIAARVLEFAWLMDPAMIRGDSISSRQLSAEVGLCRQQMSRAAGAVIEQIGLANTSTGEFQRAAKKSARFFASVTREKKSENKPSTPKAA